MKINIRILGTRILRKILKSEEGLEEWQKTTIICKHFMNSFRMKSENRQSSLKKPMKITNSQENKGNKKNTFTENVRTNNNY